LLNAKITEALALGDVRQSFREMGMEAAKPMAPADIEKVMVADKKKWGDLIQTAGIKAE